MNTSIDILRLRVLLCFLAEDKYACTVTGISKTLGEQKYKIARIIAALEQEKLIDKTNPRNPKLTDSGLRKAKKYEERIGITLNHLIYEGLDTESAYHDALYWALYSTEKSMQAIRETEERYRVKYELKDKTKFGGAMFCRHIKDGTYQFPFVIYNEHIKNKSNIAETNNFLVHPCTLIVKNGAGIIKLRATNTYGSFSYDKKKTEQIQSLMYNDGDMFIRAEKNANVFSLPASALNFINIGSGVGQILHGSLCLKIQKLTSNDKIIEDTAIFTIFI